MEEVKVGSMYGVDYVQRLQESLRTKTAECDKIYKDMGAALARIGEMQEQLAEALQALQESKNSEKELVDEIAKLTTTLKERNKEIEKLRQELVAMADVASDYNALTVSEYLDAWDREREKNRKLKKRLAKKKEQLKKVGSVLNTMETMFNIRGE